MKPIREKGAKARQGRPSAPGRRLATNRPTRRRTARHGATWRERWPISAQGRTDHTPARGAAFGDDGSAAGDRDEPSW
jgi:hypothetical protein